MNNNTIKVWDLPIRLFHWSLLVIIVLAYLSVNTDLLDSEWHWYTGAVITFLWFFRLLWGFIGTPTARFSQFFPTPRRLFHYFRHSWQGVGHTPTGGISVIVILLLLAAMITTGIFANDDITLQGPLTKYVDETWSDQMSAWHAILFNALLGIIALHVVAILFYWLVKKDNLVKPMINGKKTVPLSVSLTLPPITKKMGWRLIISLFIAALSTWLLFSPQAHSYFYHPPPAPIAPASQNAW